MNKPQDYTGYAHSANGGPRETSPDTTVQAPKKVVCWTVSLSKVFLGTKLVSNIEVSDTLYSMLSIKHSVCQTLALISMEQPNIEE